MHAYAETYLPRAQKNLGEAVDYAITDCAFSADDFMSKFLASSLAEEWESGSPRVLVGLSGIELVQEVYLKIGEMREWPAPRPVYNLSPAYWAGWSLAYGQWWSARSIRSIVDSDYKDVSDVVSYRIKDHKLFIFNKLSLFSCSRL